MILISSGICGIGEQEKIMSGLSERRRISGRDDCERSDYDLTRDVVNRLTFEKVTWPTPLIYMPTSRDYPPKVAFI